LFFFWARESERGETGGEKRRADEKGAAE
jgi:hypothetical protein